MIPYFETHITEACNLKCRGCSHFSVFAKPKHKDLEEFEREFKRLSEIEEIGIIRLMGGEPLLNPDFMKYCRIARHYFPRTAISLVTNGILGHKLETHIDELNELRINVTISDYHLDKQNKNILTELHEKGQLYNISLDPSGQQDADTMHYFCDIVLNHWYYFMDGRFYPCCIAGTIHDFWEHFDLDWGFNQDDLSIDIFNHTAEEIEEFISKPCKLCAYCDTLTRQRTYKPFSISEGKMEEWTI